jgi:hypothetical protein
MKPSELRIGNLIFFDKDVTNVDIITLDQMSQYDGDCLDMGYDSIPLTQDWLVKFGFTHSFPYGNNGFYYNDVISLGYDCEEPFTGQNLHVWITKERVPYPTIISGVQYVHQLQNLYYALTGKELTVKL